MVRRSVSAVIVHEARGAKCEVPGEACVRAMAARMAVIAGGLVGSADMSLYGDGAGWCCV